ncbi:MAG: 4Fe-4S dicluster domain-containing protein [Sphingomonadales bacterium]|nr:4Fe-4S dicluster domain-containing protein [Sphingomonadales bacterium]
MTTLAAIETAIAGAGLVARGALRLDSEDRAGVLSGRHSLVLVGFVGRAGWDAFAAAPERGDGQQHPLDRWSRRMIDAIAGRLDAHAVYPFEGPPYWPFQRWARRAEPLHPSPLGLLIHPVYGVWHSYRGALAFRQDVASPPPVPTLSPCDNCVGKSCLSACPVRAFTSAGYDVAACAASLRANEHACMALGCLARRACPVGVHHAHAPDQAEFGMQAFLAAH